MTMERNKWIHIRVTDAERQAWQLIAQSHQLTVADLIRRKLGESQPTGRQPKRRKRLCQQADPVLIRELARIGNNLNQIARWANTYKFAAEAITVCVHLLAIQRLLAVLTEQVDENRRSQPLDCQNGSSSIATENAANATDSVSDSGGGDVD